MRILVVIYEYPPIGGGGGHIARDLCLQFTRNGHQVHVLTSHFRELPRDEKRDGIHIHRVLAGRKLAYRASFWDMSGFVISGLWHGLRLMRHFSPDLIHVHFAVPSGPVAWALSRISGTPYVLTIHLGDIPGGTPEKTEHWFKWVFPFTPPIWRDAACIVAVSNFTKRLAQEHYPVEPIVIPNGIELPGMNSENISVHQPPRIIFCGRFVAQKNPLIVVKTLTALTDLPWQCFFVGDGPLRREIEQEIKHAGLETRCTLTGWVSPEEADEYLRKSDILFMPSNAEGLPITGLKSLAFGLAILASKIGGFTELVKEGQNGYLRFPDDLSGFQGALKELLYDETRLSSFRQKSLSMAQDFDIRKIAARYERLFADIVQRNCKKTDDRQRFKTIKK